jgi:glucosamine-6-phosphate deaminase
MEIIIQPDDASASLLGAKIVAKLIREKPHAVIGFATGETPLGLYRHLVEMHRLQGLDFSQVTTFNLDEFVGLDPTHPASFHSYMQENFFLRTNICPDRVNIPDGLAGDIAAFCRAYEEKIRSAGGIDIQILGIGTEGHIGFNEPSSSLSSRTRIKTLTAQARRDHAALFGGEDKVPRHVITMGLGTIMDARKCLLLAFGPKKIQAISQAIEGPITASVPVSVLQLHPHAIIILDEQAAAGLRRANYYRYVYEHKPAWQKD